MKNFLYVCILCIMLPRISHSQTYSTDFSNPENPLSDGGRWTNSGNTGLDWTNVQVTGGIACGTQTGTNEGRKVYDDSYAVLSGFSPDQTAIGVVRYKNPSTSGYQEVELLLRFKILPHSVTGYECMFRCLNATESYIEIAKLNGPLGDYTYIGRYESTLAGIRDGDTLKAVITGNVISVYVNDVLKLQAIDSTFTTGNPGIGFYLLRLNGTNTEYGFTSFSASGRSPDESPKKGIE